MEMPVLRVFDSVQDVLVSLANLIVQSAKEAIEVKGTFSLVLSGGSSPQKLYALLASEMYKTAVDWSKVDFFFGDERNVLVSDSQSNTRMIMHALLGPLGILQAHIFAINTSLPPKEAAREYSNKLALYFKGKPMRFDFILLGLGDNAHTASLFPYTDVLKEEEAKVCAVFVAELNAYRITFTAPLINQAHKIAFLVYGKNKAEAVQQVLGEKKNVQKYPAQLIRPDQGLVYWFLDSDAAGDFGLNPQ